ncbi:N-acetylmuramoyl-L-alanine amidase [Solemya elarraichensis gill symbiont]|uniref:N-acetylmuramoyl-L-alanine amidase n=1 Tax=Solemya elarraichensis gill symbiont TaxID=1918949 RepID=UPI001FE7A70E|nr:N-acetylmuramoyl-L-alanine amidase [Solemya elarraichensis gill symbiont]
MFARLLISLALLTSCFVSAPLFAGEQIKGVRSWSAPERTRLVFDTTGQVEHRIFTLDNPGRIVIDIKNCRLTDNSPALIENRFVKAMRSGVRDKSGIRLVLDLKENATAKSFQLKPNGSYGHRLVVDLYEKKPVSAETGVDEALARLAKAEQASKAAVAAKTKKAVTTEKVATIPAEPPKPARDLVIAIDAGHGGEDPGARGKRGTREKDVVLSISKKLKALVDAEPGMKGVLVRKGDYYIPLRKRMVIARKQKADFFVSIHADAFKDSRAHGASVYVLSKSGASSEAAKWLAVKENSSDLVGGVSLDDKDNVLASVLLDLSQSASMQVSHDVAGKTLGNLRKLGPTHSRKVQKARFVVLKSPDIPSMLVETAFISNPGEEKKLRKASYQKKLAEAILGGIRTYFHKSPPPDTWLARRNEPVKSDKYVIAPGDTLSEIAVKYSVRTSALRSINNINGDRIRIGQVLKIPAEG